MPTHAEQRVLPYSPAQMFDMVADVERYPDFLPWCLASRIKRQEETVVTADMVIGFRMVRERFTTQVTLDRPNRIDVEYTHGPLSHLNNHWVFIPHEDGCLIDFYVDFEFRSRVLQKLIGALFNEAVKRMVSAFEARAADLYGSRPQTVPPGTKPASG